MVSLMAGSLFHPIIFLKDLNFSEILKLIQDGIQKSYLRLYGSFEKCKLALDKGNGGASLLKLF
jgi:hypothetical protein